MNNIIPGATVGIECEVQPGPFSGERLITLNTTDGAISGFVRETELKKVGAEWRVRGVVKSVKQDTIEVWIKGSFLTTNGLASVPRQYAMAA